MLFLIILAAIAAINLIFVAVLVIAGIIRGKRPLTPDQVRQQAIDDEEQAAALRAWSLRQAAKKSRKVRA